MGFLATNKVFHHPEKYSDWYHKGDTQGPVTVKIDLTNVCNHSCPGCIDHDLIENDNNNLSFKTIESLLDGLKSCGVKGVNYTGGGEPTVHRHFEKIIRATHEKGFKIGLICNGSRFHRLPMEDLLHMFEWIRISLDSYDKRTHIRTHGITAKFDLTVSNMKLLVDIKNKKNLDVTLGAGYITNQHADMDRQLHRFIEICKSVGIDYAQLRPSFGFMYDYDTIPREEWDSIFSKAKSYKDEGFDVIIDEGKYDKILSGQGECRSYSSCHAQSFKATTITATGDVYICCSLSGKEEGHIGNIKKENFLDIWNGDNRKSTLKDLDVKKCPHLCVGDNLNEFLDKVSSKKPMHVDFL